MKKLRQRSEYNLFDDALFINTEVAFGENWDSEEKLYWVKPKRFWILRWRNCWHFLLWSWKLYHKHVGNCETLRNSILAKFIEFSEDEENFKHKRNCLSCDCGSLKSIWDWKGHWTGLWKQRSSTFLRVYHLNL